MEIFNQRSFLIRGFVLLLIAVVGASLLFCFQNPVSEYDEALHTVYNADSSHIYAVVYGTSIYYSRQCIGSPVDKLAAYGCRMVYISSHVDRILAVVF